MLFNVKLLLGTYAYACVTHEAGSTDIRLEPGRSAPQALREYASQCQADAKRAAEKADIARRAAAFLDAKAAE